MKKNLTKITNKERGSIIIESSISFVVFLSVLVAFISLINILNLQVKVDYALTQSANEISMYGYVYSALNVQSAHQEYKKNSQEATADVNQIASNIGETYSEISSLISYLGDGGSQGEFNFDNISSSIENITSSGNSVINLSKDLLKRPDDILTAFLYLGVDSLANVASKYAIAHIVVPVFFNKYFEGQSYNGDKLDTDTILKSYNVKNGLDDFEFKYSTMFADSFGEIIDLIAVYKVEYIFPLLPLPFNSVVLKSRAPIYAWTSGDGLKWEKPKTQGNNNNENEEESDQIVWYVDAGEDKGIYHTSPLCISFNKVSDKSTINNGALSESGRTNLCSNCRNGYKVKT